MGQVPVSPGPQIGSGGGGGRQLGQVPMSLGPHGGGPGRQLGQVPVSQGPQSDGGGSAAGSGAGVGLSVGFGVGFGVEAGSTVVVAVGSSTSSNTAVSFPPVARIMLTVTSSARTTAERARNGPFGLQGRFQAFLNHCKSPQRGRMLCPLTWPARRIILACGRKSSCASSGDYSRDTACPVRSLSRRRWLR